MRHFSLACVAAMILSFTACGGGGVRTEQTTPLDQVVAVANAEGVSAKLFYYKQSQNYQNGFYIFQIDRVLKQCFWL